MTEEEMIQQQRTPEEHIALAERYANTLSVGLERGARFGMITADIPMYDVYLHAADVHLKLAEAKRE